MTREIDILVRAADKGCAVVEKASHVLWGEAELREAARAGEFSNVDDLGPPVPHADVSAPCPGCLQCYGATEDWSHYRLVGQTRHFLVFARLPEEPRGDRSRGGPERRRLVRPPSRISQSGGTAPGG